MSGHASFMFCVGVDEAVDLIGAGCGGDVVGMLAVIEICFFAVAKTLVIGGLLVFLVIFMLGRL